MLTSYNLTTDYLKSAFFCLLSHDFPNSFNNIIAACYDERLSESDRAIFK